MKKYQGEIVNKTAYITDTKTGQVHVCPLLNDPEYARDFLKGDPTDDAICMVFDLC